MLCNRLSSTTPQPQPYHFSDGIDGTLQRLDESLQFARRIRAWSQSHLRQGSAVAGLIDTRSKTLEIDVDALRYELHQMGSSIADGVPPYIGELIGRIKRCIAELVELVDFYGKSREQGRSDALDALFASQFILDIDERTSYPRSLPNQQGLVKVAISIAETLGKTALNGPSLVPQTEAVRSFEEHWYVITYQLVTHTANNNEAALREMSISICENARAAIYTHLQQDRGRALRAEGIRAHSQRELWSSRQSRA